MQTGKLNIVIDMREGGDWSLDLLFAGLNYNGLNVVDIPFRYKHREWNDVLQGKVESNWNIERRTLGFCNSSIHNLESLDLQKNEIERVWLDERMESFNKYRELGLDKTNCKVVVVAGHDRFWNHSPEFVRSLYGKNFEAMLLDNWHERYSSLPFKVRRIGWSTNFDHYWKRPEIAPKKDIDICFIGYNSHPDRARFIDHIEKNWSSLNNRIFLERRPDTTGSFVSRSEMFDLMLRSNICLNVRGAADRGKTLRAYEIGFVGSFMISQWIDDPGMVEDFRPSIDCQYFSNEESLDALIDYYLAHPNDAKKIAETCNQRSLTELSVKQRWLNVIKWLNGSI